MFWLPGLLVLLVIILRPGYWPMAIRCWGLTTWTTITIRDWKRRAWQILKIIRKNPRSPLQRLILPTAGNLSACLPNMILIMWWTWPPRPGCATAWSIRAPISRPIWWALAICWNAAARQKSGIWSLPRLRLCMALTGKGLILFITTSIIRQAFMQPAKKAMNWWPMSIATFTACLARDSGFSRFTAHGAARTWLFTCLQMPFLRGVRSRFSIMAKCKGILLISTILQKVLPA